MAALIPGGRTTVNKETSIIRPIRLLPIRRSIVYPNSQQAATIWYHDHALGMTRLNVVGGLAGFYFIRDKKDKVEGNLPKGKYEIPLAIQDRVFNDDGTFNFPIEPTNPDVHPYWGPEFFGDTIMVNGLVWPKMDVDRAAYRFRILDGSTARFYNLSLSNGMNFTVIGVEGGFLKSAASVKNILIAPGERFDVLVDFSGVAPGTEIILQNSASAPFPDGDPVDPATTGQIVKFVVGNKGGRPDGNKLPATLNPTLSGAFPNLPDDPPINRTLVLTEIMGMVDTPIMLLLDGQKYDAAISELPQTGNDGGMDYCQPDRGHPPDSPAPGPVPGRETAAVLPLVDSHQGSLVNCECPGDADAYLRAITRQSVSPSTPYLIAGTETLPATRPSRDGKIRSR